MMKVSRDLRDQVLAEFPLAHAVYEVASQLEALLPIESRDALLKGLAQRALTVRDVKISADSLKAVLPDGAFPIASADALVRAVAGAARVVTELGARGTIAVKDPALSTVVSGLAREPVGRAAVATGFFGGPSLFGGEKAPSKQGGR